LNSKGINSQNSNIYLSFKLDKVFLDDIFRNNIMFLNDLFFLGFIGWPDNYC